ncbi:MAG: hypothetical protein ACFCUU_05460, partial [Cyclobacteriaceae bacterium]
MRFYLIVLLVAGCFLTGCSDDQELDLKQDYTYQATNIKVESKRVFTMHGEIKNQALVESIFAKEKAKSDVEFPNSKNLSSNDSKLQITLNQDGATIGADIHLNEFHSTLSGKFIRFTSKDTIYFVKVPAPPQGS